MGKRHRRRGDRALLERAAPVQGTAGRVQGAADGCFGKSVLQQLQGATGVAAGGCRLGPDGQVGGGGGGDQVLQRVRVPVQAEERG